MNPDDVATAINDALVQGGAQWLVATIVAFLPALWTMTLMLHLGRPYVLRTLRRCGLRLGADVWWMSYLLMRDAVLLLTFALSWVFFMPNVVQTSDLPITGSLAALLPAAGTGGQALASRRRRCQAYRSRHGVPGHRVGALLHSADLRDRGGGSGVARWIRNGLHQQRASDNGAVSDVDRVGGCDRYWRVAGGARRPERGEDHDSDRHDVSTRNASDVISSGRRR